MNRYEEAFAQTEGDAYCIYQLKESADARLFFMGTAALAKMEIRPQYSDYEAVCSGKCINHDGDIKNILEGIYQVYNLNTIDGFKGHSLSVSDVIVLKIGRTATAYYVDSIGFAVMPEFTRDMATELARQAMESYKEET